MHVTEKYFEEVSRKASPRPPPSSAKVALAAAPAIVVGGHRGTGGNIALPEERAYVISSPTTSWFGFLHESRRLTKSEKDDGNAAIKALAARFTVQNQRELQADQLPAATPRAKKRSIRMVLDALQEDPLASRMHVVSLRACNQTMQVPLPSLLSSLRHSWFPTMSSPSSPLSLDNTMGAALVGVICASVLYGGRSLAHIPTTRIANFPQFLAYRHGTTSTTTGMMSGGRRLGFRYHPPNPDIPHWCSGAHYSVASPSSNTPVVYHYVVTNYGNPSSLNMLVWSILLEVAFNGCIGLLVQGFLALRVWRLSNDNIPLIMTVGSLVLAEFASSVAFTVKSMNLQTWGQLSQLKGLSITVNIVGVVTDILITGALFFFLHRSRTGFKKSDSMISRLASQMSIYPCRPSYMLQILFTVSTGFLTSICAVASLVSILVWGHTLIYVAFYFSIGRLYSNSCLATLNARKSIRGLGEEDTDELSFSLQSFTKSDSKPMTSSRPTNISIRIDTSGAEDYQSRDSRQQEHEPDSAGTDGTL
ncbi:hypothetical protein NMY22_g1118 [Coprinellus aureogranulatus]|nr:hypothetical protein NMY22_g1118 [Coprinellus aureogranulatus]